MLFISLTFDGTWVKVDSRMSRRRDTEGRNKGLGWSVEVTLVCSSKAVHEIYLPDMQRILKR